MWTVADPGGVREVQMHPPLAAIAMYFCVHNCTSPSNDYAAVAYSSNQAQLHTHVSVPYWSPDVWLGLELLLDIQLGLLRDREWVWQSKIFRTEPPFLNF